MPLGIPHSVFLSWSQSDQDKALAYQREMRKVCQGCGTRQEEWEKDPDAYLGDIDHCEGCERLAQENNNMEGGRSGSRARLLPREVALQRIEHGEGIRA